MHIHRDVHALAHKHSYLEIFWVAFHPVFYSGPVIPLP